MWNIFFAQKLSRLCERAGQDSAGRGAHRVLTPNHWTLVVTPQSRQIRTIPFIWNVLRGALSWFVIQKARPSYLSLLLSDCFIQRLGSSLSLQSGNCFQVLPFSVLLSNSVMQCTVLSALLFTATDNCFCISPRVRSRSTLRGALIRLLTQSRKHVPKEVRSFSWSFCGRALSLRYVL